MASGGESAPEEINLMSLAVPQLNQLRTELEQTLSLFHDSLKTLKVAHTKLCSSDDCLRTLMKESEGADVLVPLSPFMYVPGKLVDVDRVMIDIGTGYYIQKNLVGARDYCNRKICFILDQMDRVQELAQEKSRIRDAVVEVMDAKIQAQARPRPTPQA